MRRIGMDTARWISACLENDVKSAGWQETSLCGETTLPGGMAWLATDGKQTHRRVRRETNLTHLGCRTQDFASAFQDLAEFVNTS
jgi:hypothetical protein